MNNNKNKTKIDTCASTQPQPSTKLYYLMAQTAEPEFILWTKQKHIKILMIMLSIISAPYTLV